MTIGTANGRHKSHKTTNLNFSYIAEFCRYRWPSGYRRSLRLFKLTVGVALFERECDGFLPENYCQKNYCQRVTKSGCTIFWALLAPTSPSRR